MSYLLGWSSTVDGVPGEKVASSILSDFYIYPVEADSRDIVNGTLVGSGAKLAGTFWTRESLSRRVLSREGIHRDHPVCGDRDTVIAKAMDIVALDNSFELEVGF